EVAEWHMDRWPVPAAMRSLSNPDANIHSRLRIAARAIKAVWQKNLPEQNRRSFVYAVLSGLRSLRLVQKLYEVIPDLFSVDVLAAEAVRECMALWIQQQRILL